MLDRRIFALVWRILGVGVGLIGLVPQFMTTAGFMGGNSLVFFTIQTNIFTTLLFAVLAVMTAVQIAKQGARGEVAHLRPSFQLAFTFYITITFVVYWTMLSWQNYGVESTPVSEMSNVFVHGITPVFAMIDSLLFLPHGKIKKINAIWWCSYPLAYYIFTVIRAAVSNTPLYTITFGGRDIAMMYPYFFIDPQCVGGDGPVAGIVIAMVFVFALFGLLYIIVDRKIGRVIKARY